MTTAQYFSKLLPLIRVAPETISTAEERLAKITKRLNADFWGNENDSNSNMHIIGSVGRKTDIDTSDVDAMFVMPPYYYHKYDAYGSNGQSAFLQEFKKSILKTYSRSDLKGDGQVVVVKLTDGMVFEIVPAFETTTKNLFLNPCTQNGGSWKKMLPLLENNQFQIIQYRSKYMARKIARLIRVWRDCNDYNISGLIIDTSVGQYVNRVTRNGLIDFPMSTNSGIHDHLYNIFMTVSKLNSIRSIGSDIIFPIDDHAKRAFLGGTEKLLKIHQIRNSTSSDTNSNWNDFFNINFR